MSILINTATLQGLIKGLIATPIEKDKPSKTLVKDTVLEAQPVLGGLYHSYKKVA